MTDDKDPTYGELIAFLDAAEFESERNGYDDG
jgi:hypothetical protein